MAASAYEVFLSHSSRDKEFVKELYRRLTRDGVRCFLDSESIGCGDNWVRALEKAIDECRYIVFVLSPDFCNSEWVEVERTSSIADDASGLKRKVRPLMLRPCRDLPMFPRFLRAIQATDVSTNSLFEQNYASFCREVGGVPQDDLVAVDRSNLPPVHPLPERHWMPYHSLGDKFVGRVGEIWNLYDSLFRDSTTAIVLQGTGVVAGTGGLGKTQLAIEYAHRFGPVYTGGVYWVNADRGLIEMVTRISATAGVDVDTKAEEAEQVAQLWRGLNARNLPCLMILDNLPENVALRPYLPTTGRVHTIITTRRQDLDQATVRLPVLSTGESVQLLNSGARELGQSAEPLAERLGGLPLALELSKSYLNDRKDLSIAALIDEMKREGEVSILKEFAAEYRDQLPSRHELDVVSTFQLSWQITPDPAKEILRVMGELAPTTVPQKLLRIILNLPLQSPLRDELSKGINDLARLSLVEVSSNGDPLAHRLILAFARHRNTVDHASPFDRCREVLLEQMQRANDATDASTNRELESLIAHAEFLISTDQLNPEDFGTLLNFVGIQHRTMGRFTAARHALYMALDSAEKSFERGHPSIAMRQSNLAMALKDLGKLDEARDLLRQTLASAEKSFEPGDPSIATRQSNLALVLQDLGKLEEARDLLRQALASDEKSFERGHPSIATRQSNLAMVLKDLGKLEEARDLLRQALASNEKSFEPGHPTIAISQSNLATVLQELGDLDEARDLLRQALASNEKSFETGHPSIAIRQSNLALVLRDLGEVDEARDLLRSALASDEKSFEADHPSIAIRQSNLALVLRDLGELDEARDLLRQALASNEKLFEAGHPSIARRQWNLALVLKDLGELDEVRDLLRQMLASDEKLFEPGHPSIAIRQWNLATVLKDLGELDEARDLLRKSYSALLERLGPDHPHTKTVRNNLENLPEP
jgi:tetratricopeptide (TPR) repeat protein